MTVGQLKKLLENYSDNLQVVYPLEHPYFDDVDIVERRVLKKDDTEFYRIASLDDPKTDFYCVVLL